MKMKNHYDDMGDYIRYHDKQFVLHISVGRYTENTEYRGIEINTASFLQISKYRDRNYWVNL